MPALATNLVGRVSGHDESEPGSEDDDLSSFEKNMLFFKNLIESNTLKEEDKTDKGILQVTDIDFKTSTNSQEHHTSDFDVVSVNKHLVIRRGQKFEVAVDFNRSYDKEKDDLRFVFEFGKDGHPSSGTHVEFILSDPDKVGEWGGWVNSASGNSLTLTLTSSCRAPVGKWKMNIDVVKPKTENSVDAYRYKHIDPIYILFNPWCKEDAVYLHDDSLCDEYVLNDKGIIFIGVYDEIDPYNWAFGQFEDHVLDCVLYLLDNNMKDKSRGDPVLVSRKISSVVNSNDEDGILLGSWSGAYDDGTHPCLWTGSEPILEEYYKTKKPVKYGQCWVFSGVVTTVCRALGIPARNVTNFSSAHDTDGSTTIDVFVDGAGEVMSRFSKDSVWNFHVWNDAWMARPLLPAGYGGWQAIDATPQEMSDGPMSLQAIRRGEVNNMHDGPFIFAEVNGDKEYWRIRFDGKKTHVKTDVKVIGKNISTKKPHSDEREDVTHLYKFKDGSEEERAAVLRAKQLAPLAGYLVFPPPKEDVEFSVDFNHDTRLGDDTFVQLKIKNTSDETRTISGTMAISSMYYTGVHFKNIKKVKLEDKQIDPYKEEVLELMVTFDEYMPNLTDHANCTVNTMFSVKETTQMFAKMTEFRFRKPNLIIKAPTTGMKGEKFTIEASFKNPLTVPLTNCELAVEGPGLQRRKIIKQSNVAANDTFVTSVDLTPAKKGKREVVVLFHCNQIYAVTGKHKVDVFE